MQRKFGKLSPLKLRMIWINSMKSLKYLTLISMIVCLSTDVYAQDKTFLLDDLKFLTGHWKGEAFGGTVEEIWSDPSESAMMGMFRLQYDGVDKLYEFLLIEKSDEVISMRFKHIRKGYNEMEDEPILLNLKNVSASFAEFATEDNSLIIKYNIVTADSIVVELTSIKQGKTEVTPINMKRKN